MGIRINSTDVDIVCPFDHKRGLGSGVIHDETAPMEFDAHSYRSLDVQDMVNAFGDLWWQVQHLRAMVDELGHRYSTFGHWWAN